MKRYKIEIIVEEGYDEFWESLITEGKTGCDDVLEMVDNNLNGIASSVKLVSFTDN